MLANVSSLFRAEWGKVVGNRRVALFMIWIFPIAATASAMLMPVLALASDGPAFSLAVLGAWAVGLVALAILLFRRQDIAS